MLLVNIRVSRLSRRWGICSRLMHVVEVLSLPPSCPLHVSKNSHCISNARVYHSSTPFTILFSFFFCYPHCLNLHNVSAYNDDDELTTTMRCLDNHAPIGRRRKGSMFCHISVFMSRVKLRVVRWRSERDRGRWSDALD